MPWSVFMFTWGVMLVAALFSLAGYFGCKSRGERIGVFYLICPATLLVAFLVLSSRGEIVRALVQ